MTLGSIRINVTRRLIDSKSSNYGEDHVTVSQRLTSHRSIRPLTGS